MNLIGTKNKIIVKDGKVDILTNPTDNLEIKAKSKKGKLIGTANWSYNLLEKEGSIFLNSGENNLKIETDSGDISVE